MNPANALTLLSCASGLCGLFALTTHRGPLAVALVFTCIGAALLLDRLDGAVARRLGLSSEMGAQLDTLADLLANGALPAALLVSRHPHPAMLLVALAYALGAVWRLARFDVGELTVGRFGPAFRGAPTSAGASAVMLGVTLGDIFPGASVGTEAAVALSMAALMPSNLRYPKGSIGVLPWMVAVPAMILGAWWRYGAG